MKKVIVSLCAIAFCGFISLQAADEKKADKPKVSKEEQFKKMDSNNDGSVSEDEFVAVRGKKDPAKAKEMFKKLDKNGDGKLSLEEFSAAGGKKKDK
jgi:Ca2+-binding EF-hand superfamily protein